MSTSFPDMPTQLQTLPPLSVGDLIELESGRKYTITALLSIVEYDEEGAPNLTLSFIASLMPESLGEN